MKIKTLLYCMHISNVQTYAFLHFIDLSCLRQTSLVQFSTMPNKPVLIHLIVWILFQIQNIYTFKDDEHYCQGAFDSYSYCRRCPNSTMFCEAPKSCHCDDIEIFSDHRKLKNAWHISTLLYHQIEI